MAVSQMTKISHRENKYHQIRNHHYRCRYTPQATSWSSGRHILQGRGNHSVLQLMRSGALAKKLKINAPGDACEQEADQAAEKVARQIHSIPDPLTPGAPFRRTSLGQTGGQSLGLAEHLREAMENAFGADFRPVRIHSDADAELMNESLQARAFTAGRDIYMGRRAFNPRSVEGLKLIAHELTHVVQQGSVPRVRLGGKPGLSWESGDHSAGLKAQRPNLRSAEPALRIRRMARTEPIIQRDNAPPGPEMVTRPLQQRAVIVPTHCTLTDPDVCFEPSLTPYFSRVGNIRVTRIFILGPVDDPHLNDMRAYIQNTLEVPAADITAVGTVEEIFQHLVRLGPPGMSVARLIIVSHGTRGGESAAGGGGGQVLGSAGWISPAEVMRFARSSPLAEQVRRNIMETDAVVEFWGCNIGSDIAARAAWSTAFGRRFRAPTARHETGTYRYYRRVPPGTPQARHLPGQTGLWLSVTSTADVPAALQQHFRSRLLEWYDELVASGEIRETDPPRNEDERFQYMSSLFDRSRGVIRFMQITETSTGETHRPGQGEWLQLWRTEQFNPAQIIP